MLFHKVSKAEQTAQVSVPGQQLVNEIELAKRTTIKKVQVKASALVWAAVVIALFVVAAFAAHALQFTSGETVFLNLTVSVTSAAAGAFIGERLALGKLVAET